MKSFSGVFITILTFLIFPVVAQSQTNSPVDVTIDRNGTLLKGKFFLTEGSGLSPTVILLHGFPGGELDVLGLGVKLAQSGINALTFNYSGTYQSEGKCSWDNMQLDIQAAFRFLQQPGSTDKYKIDPNKIFLGGWCSGGGMALTYAAYHPEVKVVFSIAPSDQTEFMKRYTCDPEVKVMIDGSFDEISYPKGHLRFEIGGSPRAVAEAGIEKINPIYDLKKCAPLLAPKNILLIGGWDDKQTTMEVFILPLYRALQDQGAKDVRFIAFQDDHYFQESRPELADVVIHWLKGMGTEE
jgi:pimeloyl-ACP methyl ester carboxylesterase